MQLAFSWWQLFDVLLSILWLISGIRDFMGKDPLIRLPFNQYERDPEYRAFWQKKTACCLPLTPSSLSLTPSCPRLLGAAAGFWLPLW